MSTSFTNYQVRASSSARVRAVLLNLAEKRAFVSEPNNRWVTVVDEASERQGAAQVCRLAKDLSRALDATVLAFRLEGSSVLEYWLLCGGKLADEYSSNPDYYGPDSSRAPRRSQGRPATLVAKTGSSADPEQVRQVLDRGRTFTFQDERLLRLATLVGLSASRVQRGYSVDAPRGWRLVKGSRFSLLDEKLLRVIEEEDAAAVHRLLGEGASADTKNSYGTSALVLAASAGNARIVDLLLSAGARDGHALLTPASVVVVRRLLKSGCDVNFEAPDGRTPLWSAVRMGSLPVVRLLIAAGADARARCNVEFQAPRHKETETTLLMFCPTPDVAKCLLKGGVDVNAVDGRGWTALMWASRWGRRGVAEALLKAGADSWRRSTEGHSALDIAKARGQAEVVELLERVTTRV